MTAIQKKINCTEQSNKVPVKSKQIGILSAALSALIFGFNPLIAKSAYAGGTNDVAFIFYSTAIAVPVLIVVLLILKLPLLPDRRQLMPILVTGIFGALTTMLLFASYNFVATGIATTLHFTYPTFVAVGSIFVLKQKLTKGKVMALVLSLGGIYLAADFTGGVDAKGILLALISGMTYASYILCMDKTGLKDINFLQICLWLSVVKLIITGGYGMAAGQLNVHMNGTAWIMTLLLALLAGIGAMSLFQIGVRYSGASNAAIFSMLEPVTSLIVGFFFMNEQMTALKWLGCVLILLGIVMTVLDEKK